MEGRVINLEDYRKYDHLKDPKLHRTAKLLHVLHVRGVRKREILSLLNISERHYWRLRAILRGRGQGPGVRDVSPPDVGTVLPCQSGGPAEDNLPEKTKDSPMDRGMTFGSVYLCSSSCLSSFKDKDKRDCKEKSAEEKPMEEKPEIPYAEIIEDLNKKTGKCFKPKSEANRKLIKARWNEGYTLEDFKKVHSNQCSHWARDAKMRVYLRPETLYRPAHFESYLNNDRIANIKTGMAETRADVEDRPVNTRLMSPRIRELKERFEK